MITHGSITITDMEGASQFWTSSQAPTTPDYTFTISNLTGSTNADIKVGDIIFYSHYMYTVQSIGSTTVRAVDRVSIKGDDAVSPTIKSIVCSHSAAVCEKDGTYNPSSIQFSAQSQQGNSQGDVISAYNGYFVIELSPDGTNWVSDYGSSIKETSVTYTIPLGVNITKNGIIYAQGTVSQSGTVLNTNFAITSEGAVTTTEDVGYIIRSIRCSLYANYENGTYTNLIDQQRVNIAFDGVDGDKGENAYSVTLTNENYTFSGNTTSAVVSNISTGFNVAECNVIAYYGGVQIPCYIGTITGMPTGMTVSVDGQNSNNAKFTVTVANTMNTQNGVLNIPVVLNRNTTDEKTFNMKFSYSLKLNGLDSTGLGLKVNYSNLSTVANGKCVYYAFEDGTKQPIIDNNVDGWIMWNGQEVLIPTGCYINPLATMPTGQTIYSVYRLNNASNPSGGGVFHDVTWTTYTVSSAGQLSKWESNTYSGSVASKDLNAWIWDEDKDIILAMYVLKENGGAITNAQLFSPPKKYSELAEPAKTMAIDAEKVATNFISIDNTGLMVADMANATTSALNTPITPSNIQSGKNVLVASDGIKIRDGSGVLATYSGDSITIGKVNRNIYIDANGVDLRDATSSIAHFGDVVRIGESDGNNITLTSNSFTGNKYLKTHETTLNDTGYEQVEVFNISVGGGFNKEVAPVVMKTSGDTVTYDYTILSSPNSPSIINVYVEVTLESGKIKTKEFEKHYDLSDSSSVDNLYCSWSWTYTGDDPESTPSEPIIIYDENDEPIIIEEPIEQIVSRETITFSCSVNYNSKHFYATLNDSSCVSDKIESVRMIFKSSEGDIYYPHYKFGVQNAYQSSDSDVFTAGDFSFNIGENNAPSGNYSFVHGADNSAQGFASFISGSYCVASGDYAHAEGNGNVASGACSHVNGLGNIAGGDYAFVSGVGNIARYEGQTVVGKYAPKTSSDDLLVVGNGADASHKSYAMRLKNDGHAEFANAVGSGLTFTSRSNMIVKMSKLRLNTPYNFFASSTEGQNGTIYWGSTAGAMAANAFGTICKMSTTAWHMTFMCGGNVYRSIFNWDGGNTTTGTFDTKQLAFVTP